MQIELNVLPKPDFQLVEPQVDRIKRKAIWDTLDKRGRSPYKDYQADQGIV